MTVLCTISVIAMKFLVMADVEGKVLAEGATRYVVDFSIDATKRGFEGDYSRRIVSKDNCVAVQK